MCGIIGYVGRENAAEILFEGLKRLEYRGYDSAGIAVLSDKGVDCIKKSGRVSRLEGFLSGLSGDIGIGHTRWATHGKPSDKNAHPHRAGRITAVHNGIIENYAALKEELIAEGRVFFSDTDSEVIPHLIDKYYEGDLVYAVRRATERLKGSYAVCALCEGVEGIAVAKKNSPAIVGRGRGGLFVSSDAPALAGYAEEVDILRDGEIAFLGREGIRVFGADGRPIVRAMKKNTAEAASLDLGECPHYMLKETREIPAAVKNTAAAVAEAMAEGKIDRALRSAESVIAVGCGTAYHACMVAARWIESIAGIPARAEIASEMRYKKMVIRPNTLVIAVSQSGETADTLAAVAAAAELGARVIAVTNVEYSAITRAAHAVVPVAAGSEICVAATKSYVGQLVALYFIAAALKEGGYHADSPLFSEIWSLPKLCGEVLQTCCINGMAEEAKRSGSVYFIGRGIDGDVAAEGSLKLKEVSLKPSEGYPAGELKHGTLALIDGHTFTVAIVCDERLAEKTISAIEQIVSRGGRVAAVCGVRTAEKRLKDLADHVISLPECSAELSPALSVIPLFLLAYRTAVLSGCDPDKPRNLAKSVTVE